MTGSGAWYREGTVTVTNGSASIVGVNTNWLTALIAVAVGDIFTIDSKTWYEIVSVSTDTGITLDRNFEGATVAGVNYAIIRNTSGTVLTRIAGQVAVQFNQKQLLLDELRTWLNSTNATETVTDSHGVSTAITTPTQMASEHSTRVAQVDTLVNGISAMTKAEFFALAEQRKSQSAGSGFLEWGKHDATISTFIPVNEGVWQQATVANILNMGGTTDPVGKSKTVNAITNIAGVTQQIKNTNYADSSARNVIKFPGAPDGTKTYDSSTGTVTQHASSAIAFAAETATNKVITSRQDFVFIECWHEKISDKDVVYPLGNVQYGATVYEGVALAVNGIAQGYSAFGEWDSVTIGNCAVWANLTDTQKAIFTQNPENNIYSDEGELIQVRYRVRVVEGLGDDWTGLNTAEGGEPKSNGINIVTPQCSGIVPVTDTTNRYMCSGASVGFIVEDTRALGAFGVRYAANTIAHNGLCFAVPIALVQRRNQGAYHPVWNPEGCVQASMTGNPSGRANWYEGTAQEMTNTSECFTLKTTSIGGNGEIGNVSGRPDSKFHDAIYASDVKDLRMSAKKLPLKEIREKYKRMAIAGEVRGFEGVPFTTITTFTSGAWGASGGVRYLNGTVNRNDFLSAKGDTASIYVVYDTGEVEGEFVASGAGGADQLSLTWKVGSSQVNKGAGKLVLARKQTHKQAKPTWTDIIGDPANIAATFPNGVEGQWIPVIPDGANDYFPLNRKGINSGKASREYTNDNGGSWTSNALLTFDAIGNVTQFDNMPATQVMLYHYETQAHFTQDDVNSKVLDLGGVFGFQLYVSGAATLMSGLIGKIPKTHANFQNILPTATGLDDGTGRLYVGSTADKRIAHPQMSLANYSAPALKFADYLSHDNNVAKLCYAYKEMIFDNSANAGNDFTVKPATDATFPVGNYNVTGLASGDAFIQVHAAWNANLAGAYVSNGEVYSSSGSILSSFMSVWNGNGFGDNNQFEIADNQNTLTDDNGNSVLYGTASFDTQYFITEE